VTANCPAPTKTRHATQEAAQRAARTAAIPLGRHLNPYRCRCGWWHLTKLTPPA
jgi:hypothetical protein